MSYKKKFLQRTVYNRLPAANTITLAMIQEEAFIQCDMTGAGAGVNYTIATPTATEDGLTIVVKHNKPAGFDATLATAGAETIEAAATRAFTADNESVVLRWDNGNTAWRVMSDY